MLGTLGWIVLGAVVGAVAVTVIDLFWDDIATWLNNTAADAVGRVLGYNARNHMQRAVTVISRLRDKLHNKAIIYTKKTPMDSFYQKVTYETEAPVYQIDDEVLEEVEEQGQLVQEFRYNQ